MKKSTTKSAFKDAVFPKKTSAPKNAITISGDSNLPLVAGYDLGGTSASGLTPPKK